MNVADRVCTSEDLEEMAEVVWKNTGMSGPIQDSYANVTSGAKDIYRRIAAAILMRAGFKVDVSENLHPRT